MRRKLSRKSSRKAWKKPSGSHPKNRVGTMRGGRRL